MAMQPAARKISIGLAAAFGLFLECIAIRPFALTANQGLSYYGSFRSTIIPYSLALLISTYIYWTVARDISRRGTAGRYLATVLRVMAVLFVGLLLTPRSIVDAAHTVFGVSLFASQLLLSLWLFLLLRTWPVAIACIVQFISGLLAFHDLLSVHGFLLQEQVAYQFAFWGLLIYALNRLPLPKEKAQDIPPDPSSE
jgi:hypothetical protein